VAAACPCLYRFSEAWSPSAAPAAVAAAVSVPLDSVFARASAVADRAYASSAPAAVPAVAFVQSAGVPAPVVAASYRPAVDFFAPSAGSLETDLLDALRGGDPHVVGSQADWPERWVDSVVHCSVGPVELRWAVRSEIGRRGYLAVPADWADSAGDCSVVLVELRWAVQAEAAAGQPCYRVAPADWAGRCDSPVGLTGSPAVPEAPYEHWVSLQADSQLATGAPASVLSVCHRCFESLAVDE
jgi:hypothetical protein